MSRFDLGFKYTNIHFIGIGGINMSALAEVLFRDGYVISGSDKQDSPAVAHLRKLGITVYVGHEASNLADAVQVVVHNAAVGHGNPERVEAAARGLHIIDRAELLGLLMRNYENAICVAGTHGKTTTTSMLAEIFMQAGADPTVMSGGVLPSMGGAMRIAANKEYFIAEACEYHDSFLKFYPKVGIILNLEKDHSDYFDNEDGLWRSFRRFAEKIPADGVLIINSEIKNFSEIVGGLKCGVIGFNDAVYKLIPPLRVPGEHNIANASAAWLVAQHFGLELDKVDEALRNFTGAKRRFERLGKFNDADIIDDYAHHPTEVAATLTAAKSLNPARLWVIFQAHTHNRTREFLQEFAEALKLADFCIITDIYRPAGREEEKAEVHAKDLAALLENSIYMPNFDEIVSYLQENLQPQDMAISMGAGDIHKVTENLLQI